LAGTIARSLNTTGRNVVREENPTPQKDSFESFIASKKKTSIEELASYWGMDVEDFPNSQYAFVYLGDLYIEVLKDGKYYLMLENQDWIEDTIDLQEKRLYEFYRDIIEE